jgi:hypothetical protein
VEALRAEVRDLARDRPRRCHGCDRTMRYWPTEAVPVQRAGSRGDSFRCQGCLIAPEIVSSLIEKRPPDLDWIIQTLGEQLGTLAQQYDEISRLPPSPSLAAEQARALDLLCRLIQLAAEDLTLIEQHRTDADLVEQLLRTGRAAHPGVPLRGVNWHAAQA